MADPTIINGRYEILGPLGAGGMGTLYRARDPRIGNRVVAIKLLKEGLDNEELRRRFKQEGDAAGVLQHENIVRVIDVGDHNGAPFIAMEYIDGETLAALIRRSEPLSLIRRLQIMEELCDGLAYAHSFGIIHRDIKPANLMLERRRGHLGRLKILDFGIAKMAEAGLTNAGALIGTFNYMSPEQMRGSISLDHRSDIFSVGAVCYELLCYRQAFPGALQDGIMGRIIEQQPVPLRQLIPTVDRDIERVVTRALEKDRERRFPDLSAMLDEIRRRRAELEHGAGADETVVPNDDNTQPIGTPTPTPRSVTPTPRPPTPTPRGFTPNRGMDPDRLEQIRRRQIAECLDNARSALAAGHLEQAIEQCERASAIEPLNAEAIALHGRVQREIEERDFNQLIGDAKGHIGNGELTAADQVLDRAEAMNLDAARLEDVRQQISDQRQRLSAGRAIARGREKLAAGDLMGAEQAATEAAAKAPAGMQDVAEFRAAIQAKRDEQARQLAHQQAAERAAAQARAEFAAGRHAEAIAALARFTPPHPIVTALRASLETEAADIERQRADAQRLEQERIAEERRKTQERIEAARRQEEARVRAERERAEQIAQEAAATIEHARRLLKSGGRQQAITALRTAPNASHPDVLSALDELTQEVARLDEHDRLEAMRRAEEAIRHAEEAEHQQQAALETAAVKAIARARRQFERGHRDRAVTTLSAPEVAGHPRVTRYRDEIQRAPLPVIPPAPWWRSPVGYGAGLVALGVVGVLVLWSRQSSPPIVQPSAPPVLQRKADVAPQKPAAATPPVPAAKPAGTDLAKAARETWNRGERDEAFGQIITALKEFPDDTSLQTLLREMVEQATVIAGQARAAALSEGGSRSLQPFAQAEDVVTSAAGAPPQDALPRLWKAERLFASATQMLVQTHAAAMTSSRAYRAMPSGGSDELRRRRRAAALNDVTAALTINPHDLEVSQAMAGMLNMAVDQAFAARAAAEKEGATRQLARYRQADELMSGARTLDASARLQAFWNAADAFNDARLKAIESRKTVSAAPPASGQPPVKGMPAPPAPPPAKEVSAPSAAAPAVSPLHDKPASGDSGTHPPVSAQDPERRADEAAVRGALRSYEAAYSAMDLRAVSRIFPTERENAKQSFGLAKSVRLTISDGVVQINGNVATVACVLNYRYDWKRSGPPPTSSTNATLILRRDKGGWTILSGNANDR